MSKEMLINVSEGEECRIAVLENGRLEELYMERASATSHVGNIYKGKVTNVEPAIQAAFIDFGLARNGFLHISDLLPTYFGKKGEDIQESVGRKLSRRDRPPIQRCLKRGDEIQVQIIKEGIGTKGPTLSSYLSIPGRILVMMPGMENFGVSRKIEDDAERRRLRKILDELDPIEGVGFIIRTAGMGKTKAEIEKDLKYLTKLWETIGKISKTHKAPVELYTEGDLVTRTVRDVFGPDVEKIIVDSKDVAKTVKDFVKLTAPRGKTKVELYKEAIPLFHAYGVEKEIELIHSRTVPLKSGGSLVIDSTEAIVAIDVNSGKFRDHSDAETTAFKTDMEAADEIPRQLKLRDLGGVIICDFIDLRYERHRRQLEQRLYENFKSDKAKTRVLRMSEFGIIEITRQRMRASLKRSIYSDCPHCRGHGLVKTPESMALDVMRKLAIAANDQRVVRLDLAVCEEVAFFLANRRRKALSELEDTSGKEISIAAREGLALDEMKLDLFDARDGKVFIDALGMVPERDERGHGHGHHHRGDGGGRGERGGGRHSHRKPPEPVRAFQSVDEDDVDVEESGDDRGAKPQQQGQPHRGQQPQNRQDGGRGGQPQRGGNPQGQQRGGNPPHGQRPGGDGRDNRGGPRNDNRGNQRGDQRNDNRGQQPPGSDPRRDRDFDRVRPVGQDQVRSGDGHRGPKVVEETVLDEAGQPVPAGQPGQQDQPPVQRFDENGNPIPGEGGRRRRRRRRGGRGRRRNRGQGAVDAQGNPIPGTEGAPQDNAEGFEAEGDFGDDEGDDVTEGTGPVGSTREASDAVAEPGEDESSSSLGEAPGAVGDDGDVDEMVDPDDGLRAGFGLPAPNEVTDEPVEIGEAPEAVTDEGGDEYEIVERTPRSARKPAAPVEKPKADAGDDEPKVGKRKRSRGGRGRGRGKKADAAVEAPVEAEAPAPEPVVEAPKDEEAPKKGRRTRSRGRGKKKAEDTTEDAATPSRAEASAQRVPPKPASETPAAIPPAIKVVRTGFTDKHLADDEPVDPQPLRRPRSFRDLDAIPDDMD